MKGFISFPAVKWDDLNPLEREARFIPPSFLSFFLFFGGEGRGFHFPFSLLFVAVVVLLGPVTL